MINNSLSAFFSKSGLNLHKSLVLLPLLLVASPVQADVPAKKIYKVQSPSWSGFDYLGRPEIRTKLWSNPIDGCSYMNGAKAENTSLTALYEVFYQYPLPAYFNDFYLEQGCVGVYRWRDIDRYGRETSGQNSSMYSVIASYYCDSAPSTFYSSPRVCIEPNPLKSQPGQTCDATNKPISYAYGNKFLDETDYQSNFIYDFPFKRYYNSTTVQNGTSGSGWRNSLNRAIRTISGVRFGYRPDGKMYDFKQVVSPTDMKFKSDADINDVIIYHSTSPYDYSYIRQSGEVEKYYSYGDFKSITNINTLAWNVALSTTPAAPSIAIAPYAGLPISITDNFGRSIKFIYDNMNRIKTMINPAGGVYTYTYDANNNLSSVTYPDLTVKTYHYGEVGHVASSPAAGVLNANLLTGITDEKGNRYADYYYDAQGRAFDENLAGGVEATNLVYNTDGLGNPTSTVVTDSLGNVRTHNFTTVLGVAKSTGQSQPAGSGCAAAASALTYDANGNVASRVDFNGNKTTYIYDLTRNLETSRTEGLTAAGAATTASRTITTTWHATWRLPLVISEYSGASATGTPIKRTTTAYDSKGNITSYTEEDPVRSLSRTTTTTYTYSTAVPGLVLEKVVDGPRPTDIDRTIYTYYPHDATCVASTATPLVDPLTSTSPTNLGCRGQLLSVLRPVGITTYDRYNHHGQLEQMTDPNGVVTEFTYDLRQRLTSETTGTESTQFTYDNAGLLVQTKFPDNSELNYIYDNAHRLTEISNTTGDKVVYTLDSEGNRTQEVMYDAYGSIAKSLTRQFDALNRAQQVTGE